MQQRFDNFIQLASGGFYRPEERDPELVREDVIDGFVSLDRAREVYRVALNPETLELNLQETEKLRSAGRK